jgi:Putative peptidoglycan binding domain
MRTAAFLLLLATTAQAQQPQAAPDPRLLAAQQAFEALSESERRAIQQDLTFATRFSGAAAGNFGSLTFAAIQSFEKDKNLVVDGILTPQERQALAVLAAAERRVLKFSVQDDRRTGARLGIPEALLSRRTDAPTGGSRWQNGDGKVTLETQVYPSEEPLPALFEKAIAPAASGRKVTYKLLRPDFFVVSGETASGKFYRRVSLAADGKMRGFSLGYDKALEAQMARLVIAIANSYEAFPPTATAGAVAPRAASVAAPQTSVQPTPPADRLATGLLLDSSTVLTSDLAIKDCRILAVGPRRNAGHVLATDAGIGLALIRTEGLTASGVTVGTLDPTQAHVVLAQGWSGAAPVTQFGEAIVSADGKRMAAPLQPGGTGAALFNRQGILVGVVRDDPAARKQVAGIVPIARYALVSAADITRFLEKNALSPAKPAAISVTGSVAADRRASITPVHCTP